jgi:hypothetical protein
MAAKLNQNLKARAKSSKPGVYKKIGCQFSAAYPKSFK